MRFSTACAASRTSPPAAAGQRGEGPATRRRHPRIVEPHSYADPELKSSRRYSKLSAAEVRKALLRKGYSEGGLPSERTMRDILNRMNYRLKRIRKGEPPKKPRRPTRSSPTPSGSGSEARKEPKALEISMDAEAKVALGNYVRGENQPSLRETLPKCRPSDRPSRTLRSLFAERALHRKGGRDRTSS